MQRYSRREFLGVAAAGSGALLSACSLEVEEPRYFTHADALISARPGPLSAPTPPTGYQALGLSTIRDGMLYVPTTYNPATPAPLAMLLHNRSGSAQYWEDYQIGEMVDDLGIVVVAPDSRNSNWDYLEQNIRGYGPDPKFMNFALAYVFQRLNINPQRIALGGFVDGGFEALGVGIANGDLFTHLLAFSPSGLLAPWIQGKPKVYLSVGDNDTAVLDFTNTQMVDKLVANGYTVQKVQFDGGVELPDAIARQSFEWFLA
jgi:phospholipase/carboxylesterase